MKRIVLVGEPNTGKTSLILHLTRCPVIDSYSPTLRRVSHILHINNVLVQIIDGAYTTKDLQEADYVVSVGNPIAVTSNAFRIYLPKFPISLGILEAILAIP